MIAYITRRLMWMVVVIFGVMTIAFFISRVVPADPVAAMLPPQAPQEAIEKERAKWGLDEPIYKQYLTFVRKLLQGDLGTSIRTRSPVLSDLARYLPATIELTLLSLFFGIGLGLPLGIISAIRNGKLSDHFSRLFAIMGLSMPAFWTGILLLLIFYHTLRILPGPGQLPTYMGRPPRFTGFITLDSMIAGNWKAFWSAIRHMILP
ncbi:MAG: ABC transporter permease, partial [Candidatus Bipolaricaulota bacterium]